MVGAGTDRAAGADGRRDKGSDTVAQAHRHWYVVAALLAYAFVVVAQIAPHRFDVSRLVVAGDRFFSLSQLTYPIHVEPHSDGYDGQFYYRLALDPLDHRRVAGGITMEPNPTVRAQRILYPALAWALSFGDGRLVPFMLMAINLVSVAALAAIALGLARHFVIPAPFALLLPFYPGFVLSISRDTIEILATALALAAVLAGLRERFWIAALMATAAILARETTLLYLAGFGIVAAYRSLVARRLDGDVVPCLVPVIVMAGWQVALRRIWGSFPVEALGPHDLSPLPLVGYARWLAVNWRAAIGTFPVYRLIFTAVSDLLVPLFIGYVALRLWRRRRGDPAIVIAGALYVGTAFFFTGAIWNEPYGFLRVLCDAYALGVAALMSSGDVSAIRRLVPVVAATWLAAVVYVL